jgi:hypothetical protein
MAVELVILSHWEPELTMWTQAATEVVGGGDMTTFVGGSRHMIDMEGRTVVTFWPSRAIENAREAISVVGKVACDFGVWTDACLPSGAAEAGRAVAERVAAFVGGVVVEWGR